MIAPVFYNDNDAYCAQWLRNLGDAGLLPVGIVDERSIIDIEPDDLAGYEQCHFFAGIGGWPYALRLAGWEGEAWTGSCPCQPLSSAGQRRGHADERHLWPAFYALIAQCRPATIFGEQVASKAGREWLAGVRADLEAVGYAVGGADLPAAGIGAPHIRQRLFWVAHAERAGSRHDARTVFPAQYGEEIRQPEPRRGPDRVAAGGPPRGMDDANGQRCDGQSTRVQPRKPQQGRAEASWAGAAWLPCLDGKARRTFSRVQFVADGLWGSMVPCGTENQPEEMNASTPIARSGEALRGVRRGDVATEIRRGSGGSRGLPATEILQPSMHGARANGSAQGSHDAAHQPQTLDQVQEDRVRELWWFIASSRPSQGRQPFEQHGVEPRDVVHVLSHQRALADVEGDKVSVEALQALLAACKASGLLQYTLHALSQVWRCAADQGADRQFLASGSFRIVSGSPLATNAINRAAVLRGAGNGIVAPLAAQFVSAWMETNE